jgi:hypothetical protein
MIDQSPHRQKTETTEGEFTAPAAEEKFSEEKLTAPAAEENTETCEEKLAAHAQKSQGKKRRQSRAPAESHTAPAENQEETSRQRRAPHGAPAKKIQFSRKKRPKPLFKKA